MAHELDIVNGKASMFSSRGMLPWHGLGTVINEDAVTSSEAIKLAGLDYDLYKTQVYTIDPDGKKIDVPDSFAVVRGDINQPLGIVGKNYEIFQNSEAFSFFDEIVGEKLAVYETAGALHGGRKVWILAKLPQELYIKGTEDRSNAYILLGTSHDGSQALMMMPTITRVVCNNTYTLAVNNFSVESGIKIRHTRNIKSKVDIARDRLKIVNTQITEYNDQANYLASVSVDLNQFKVYVERLFPDNKDAKHNTRTVNMRNMIMNNYDDNEFKETNGTAWAAFNAVTRFVDHQRSTKGGDDNDRKNNRMESVLFTTGAAKKRQAFELALAL
jgi:phage/plasmid-like protein (TIGR03299 family)